MNQKLKRLILLALLRCDGLSMPEDALLGAVQLMSRPENPTRADVELALKAVETSGYVLGLSDDLTGKSWSLTQEGNHRAAKL
jgi:hypothetical protein